MRWLMCGVAVFFVYTLSGQEEVTERWIEDQAYVEENKESEEDLNQLQHFRLRPLNLNVATKEDLGVFPFLTALHVEQFIFYRKALGPLHHVMELQAIPAWDPDLIRKILPFVSIVSNLRLQDRLVEDFKKSNQQLLFRSSLSNEAGFLARYHFQSPSIRFGINVEKDRGELFIQPGKGIAFVSAHAALYGKGILKHLVIGDYLVNFGQGLLLWQGRGMRKNGMTVMVKRQLPPLQEYRSNDENRYMRGLAAVFRKRALGVTVFLSRNKLDANTSMDNTTGKKVFTSLLNTGIHRSTSELYDKNSLGLISMGIGINYTRKALGFSYHELMHVFSVPMQKDKVPYNLYATEGTKLHGHSLSFYYTWRNAHFFGEMAQSGKGRSILQGLMVAADRNIDVAVLYRRIDKNYRAYGANAFLESSEVNNEEGIYVGATFRPSAKIVLDLYTDQFHSPWLRYRLNSPSYGWDHFTQMTWNPDKKTMVLIRWKQESKMGNENGEAILKKSFSTIRENFRFHLEHQFSTSLEWRTRFEVIWVKGENTFKETGILAFSDLLWKSFKTPVSWGIRWMIYDTPSYETRIYAYENDVMFYNIVPAFYGRGTQVYFNLRYKASDKLNFFLKCSNRWEGGRAGWFSRFQIIFFW